MARAGVQLVSLFYLVSDLMRDWRNTPGTPEVYPFLDKYYTIYGYVARGHAAAIQNGTLNPAEVELV
jgi:hypothetical protein